MKRIANTSDNNIILEQVARSRAEKGNPTSSTVKCELKRCGPATVRESLSAVIHSARCPIGWHSLGKERNQR